LVDKKGESGKYIAFGLLIGAAVGAASVYVPLASYVAPAFLAFVFAAWGASGIAAALVGAVGVTLGITLYAADAAAAAYILALYVPSALIIGYVIRKKLPWRAAVSISALAMGLALYLNLCLLASIHVSWYPGAPCVSNPSSGSTRMPKSVPRI
jgi:hypothetical protein